MDAPTGTFIAFATAPGSVAADGAGDNGVYTKYLVAEMAVPGLPIEQVFKQVRNSVMAETKGRQIPWESSSLRGEFSFLPGAAPSVAEAVAAALKREREVQQAELQRLQLALERQQKQLEALGLRPQAPAAAQPVKPEVPAAPVKPVAVATVAPGTVTNRRLPQVGDSWTYRLSEPRRADGPKQREYVVQVAAVTPNAILDQYRVQNETSGEWAHGSGGYIVGLGRSVFAPYLFSIGTPGERGPVRVEMLDPACSGGFGYLCEASANVVGRESVKVPAGTFEAIKVVVEHNWRPISMVGMQFAAQQLGGRKLTVWYAPAAKRAVKFSSRATYGGIPPIETDFDLELTSYKLKP
jgi:hypothetical protein